jgi:hypothetical protein
MVMHSSLSNLSLFAFALAKVGALTGLIPAAIFACCAEKWRVIEFGFEKVSGEAVRARILIPADLNSDRPTSLSRKVRRYA